MSGNLRKIWSQGYCVQTALNVSFVLLSLLENRRQCCVNFDFSLLFNHGNQTYILYYYNFSDKNRRQGAFDSSEHLIIMN